MGWVDEHEQQTILSKYKRQARLVCNSCKLPIFESQIYTVDPNGGYFKKDKHDPVWLSLKPKVTYHLRDACDPVLAKRHDKKAAKLKGKIEEPVVEKESGLKSVKRAVLELIKGKKKREYWMKTIVVRELKHEYEKAQIRKALRILLAKGKLRKVGKYLYPARIKKGVR